MKDMHKNIVEIHDDPAAGWVPVAMPRAHPLVAEPAGDFVGDGLEVRFGSAGANDEEVRHARNAADIQDDRIFRLLAEGDFAAELGQFLGSQPAIALH